MCGCLHYSAVALLVAANEVQGRHVDSDGAMLVFGILGQMGARRVGGKEGGDRNGVRG